MQQPGLAQLLTEGRVLVKCCDEKCRSGNSEEQREDVDGNPFSFTPQLIHLHKDHEMFEDGDVCRHMYLQDLYISETDDKQILSVSEFACHISGCCAVFSTLEGYEHHYNSLHRHVCCSCRRSFPSARLLDIHIQEWHDSLFTILAERQDMYQCLVEGCGQRFRTSKHRKDHLIRVHKYPPDFRFDKSKKDKGTRGQKEAAVEMVEDVCDSEGVCEVMSDVLSSENEHVESMETHACEEARGAPSADEAHIDASAAEPPKHRYTYRVPASVCFGHGSVRGFRGRRGKRK